MDIFQIIMMFGVNNKDNPRILYLMVFMFIMNQYGSCILEYLKKIDIKRKPKSKINFVFKIKSELNGAYATIGGSRQMQALMWKIINENKDAENSQHLYLTMNLKYDKTENNYFVFYNFPKTAKAIKLDNDIFAQIDLCSRETTQDSKGENKLNEITTISINLYSYSFNLSSLEEWYENLYQSFKSFLEENKLHNENKYIYISNPNNTETKYNFTRFLFSSKKTFDNLYFEGKEMLIERLDDYNKNIVRYEKLGIPHTLGFLFHGYPGCGKTSTIKAIANYLNRSIVNINLNHLKNINQLRNIFLNEDLSYSAENLAYSLNRKKRLYVFEEIDCSGDIENNPLIDRNLKSKKKEGESEEGLKDILKSAFGSEDVKNKKDDERITLGQILELLDGITETDDRIIIFTTNYPDRLDKALIRPGRIDMILEFKKLRRVDIANLYKLWFNKSIPDKKLNKIKDYMFSQAEFGKLCFEYSKKPEKLIEKLISF